MSLRTEVCYLKDVPVDDLFGIFYVRKPDGLRWESYYRAIDSLRALFDDEEFRKFVHGFYLNIAGKFDSVRISYFVDAVDIERSTVLFQEFFAKNGLLEIDEHSSPHRNIIAGGYGGIEYEQRFRNFLRDYTQIGLELLQENLLHSRRLFTVYRFQVRQGSMRFEGFFEPTFNKYSPTYVSFSSEKKSEFFGDLEISKPPHTGWAHMMVNMIVGCDFPYSPHNPPLTIAEINRWLTQAGIGFQIPANWNPQSFDV
jgi:hypothetical protein